MGEAIDGSLKRFLGLNRIICDEHLAYENPSYIGFNTKAGQVEENTTVSGLKVHSVL